ncbi:MAG: GNAT family N-acetyltransferase [Ignavibacteria bacterium]|nr:GNAT family N-acetyltransferase [Ignavibacteria bacterium]
MIFNENVFDDFPVLRTGRLLLREITPADAKEIFAIYSSDAAMKYFGKDTFKTIDEAYEMIERVRKGFRDREGIRWGISFKDSDMLIGSGGFWRLIKPHFRAEIGYDLHPDYWGKGIMTEAVKAMIEFGFGKMNLHSIEANTDPENAASARLLGKNGFVKEGIFRESYYYNGVFLDSHIYSLIKKN